MPDQLKITIAIDGFSSCGKSTLARDLATRLGYVHIDSGAMYRAVTLYLLQNEIDPASHEEVNKAIGDARISFITLADGRQQTLLNGTVVEKEIRSMEVNRHVSPVSTISSVRRALVAQQRILGAGKGIVMDGRDIGTVVFPEAQLKLFLTASLDVRVERRYHELIAKGMPSSRDEVLRSITERDEIDSTRADSPLRKADDAIVIDNTGLSREEQLAYAYDLALDRIREANTSVAE